MENGAKHLKPFCLQRRINSGPSLRLDIGNSSLPITVLQEEQPKDILDGTARRVVFPMEYQKGKLVLFYRKTRFGL